MANNLDFLAKLSLDLDNLALDQVLALRLGTQAEAFHAPTCFIHNYQQVSAAPDRNVFYGATDVEVNQFESVVMALVMVAKEWILDHLSLLTPAAYTRST